MKIEKNKVVTFHYTLKKESGEEVENSEGSDPVAYLHGHGNILKGLETALLGKSAGETCNVTLAAEQAYGPRQEAAKQRIPIKHLLNKTNTKTGKAKSGKIRPGMTVQVQTDQGPKQVVVEKVGKFNVDVDTNHPLAGETLTFDIQIVDVRDPSDDEIAHSHAHGAGGHHH